MPGIDKECEGKGATHHMACACREEGFRKMEVENIKLREALHEVFALIDAGVFVRDVSRDADPDWCLKMIPFVQRLKKARAALGESKP